MAFFVLSLPVSVCRNAADPPSCQLRAGRIQYVAPGEIKNVTLIAREGVLARGAHARGVAV